MPQKPPKKLLKITGLRLPRRRCTIHATPKPAGASPVSYLAHEDQVALADTLDVFPEKDIDDRIHATWFNLASLLPREAKRITGVRCTSRGRVTYGMCIYIATNVSHTQIAKAENRELVSQVQAVLQTDVEPQWFKRIV